MEVKNAKELLSVMMCTGGSSFFAVDRKIRKCYNVYKSMLPNAKAFGMDVNIAPLKEASRYAACTVGVIIQC